MAGIHFQAPPMGGPLGPAHASELSSNPRFEKSESSNRLSCDITRKISSLKIQEDIPKVRLAFRRGVARIFLLVFLLICIGVSPARAAGVVISTSLHDVTFSESQAGSVCGITGIFTVVHHIEEFHFTLWTNNHFVFSALDRIYFYNSSGSLIAFSHFGSVSTSGTGQLPLVSEKLGYFICSGSSLMPGLLFSSQIGFTIGVNGQLVEIHSS
jgi:hypothetical protein